MRISSETNRKAGYPGKDDILHPLKSVGPQILDCCPSPSERNIFIRLVLADDLPIVLDGLEGLFRKEPDIEVLARCRRSEEILQAVRKFQPDVLILGMQRPGPKGLAVLRELKEEEISTRVILLTVDLDEDELLEAVRLDVSGVLMKEMPPHLFVQCVRKVHAGERWLEMRSFGRALEGLLRREASAREVSRSLSPREIEIVCMVFDERSNKEIAQKLSIAEGTVKSHLHHIYEKLNVNNRRTLARYVRDQNVIRPNRSPAATPTPTPHPTPTHLFLGDDRLVSSVSHGGNNSAVKLALAS